MRGKIFIGVLAAGGVAAALLYCFWPFGPARKELRLPGVVEIQEVRLGSKVGGRVAAVLVREGDTVAPNQELVRLEAPELEAQRDQLLARLRESECRLEKARNGARPEERDLAAAALEVARARLTKLEAGNRPEEIRQAKSDLDAAEADLRQAIEEFDRADRIFRMSAGTQSDYLSAKSMQERCRGRRDAARAKFDLLEAGTRKEDIEVARAEVRQAESNLHLVEAAARSEDLREAEAVVEELRGKLRETEASLKEAVIRAPEAAVVEVVAVRRGDLAAPNQPLLKVLRAGDLWVKVYVPETELGKVRLNQEVAVTVDAYPGRRFGGKVDQIASEAEFTPRNVQSVDERHNQVFGVRVRVADPQGVFKSGMAADVFVPLAE